MATATITKLEELHAARARVVALVELLDADQVAALERIARDLAAGVSPLGLAIERGGRRT